MFNILTYNTEQEEVLSIGIMINTPAHRPSSFVVAVFYKAAMNTDAVGAAPLLPGDTAG